MALSFTDENFETEVINSEVPVLVDFWAPWCGPCKAIGPIIDQLAAEYTDVKIGKVNVDNEGMVAQQYGISSIPAILLFKNGEVVDSMIGAQPKTALQNMINRHR
ncbi:MAG: thioredoxin [Pirellulaceae bacterium]|jgi:thioredoxin 1|nr:thioredoxin [Pirellulaceae bacterium]